MLPYYQPELDEADVAAVAQSLRSGWLTSGPRVRQLEEAFARLSGVKHAVAVNSCTAAVHLALVALGVGPGDEVVLPSLSFVACANSVRQLGGKPVFADVDAETLCVTVDTLEAVVTPRTKAIVTMNYGGQPVGIDSIAKYARARGLGLIEDAAHAVGTLDAGRWPGTFSDAAAFSFYATKNVTSGEGGLLLTNRSDIAEKVRALSLHGLNHDAWKRYEVGGSWRYDVTEIGYKCNLADFVAALACSQLDKLDAFQQKRDLLARSYMMKLERVPGVRALTRQAAEPNKNSWCLFAISVDQNVTMISRDDLIERLNRANIGTSVHFIPTHLFSIYKSAEQPSLPVTERIWETLISLPLYPAMEERDVDDVVDALSDIITSAQSSARSINA
ncbi:MAG TPA: DegT/DnrJ/EryC1/StrS aminotransferase family protein [Candidatus Acidoferrales bacterium]|nr:DegT/DnrJ/EryC1/StrS aminotransferase family protein [Candidatus Acidoferrales bacterium]